MKTKLFILLSFLMTSSAFGVSYCKIQGTERTTGVYPGDSQREASIYVQGRGYNVITHVEDEGEVLISRTGSKEVVLDFRHKSLKIDGQNLKLVKCVRNGSE